MEFDFNALSQAITDSTAKDYGDPPDPPAMWWHFDYPPAIEKALLQHDFAMLFRLLEKEHPIHPLLLPALAQAIKSRGRNKPPGRRKILTGIEAERIATSIKLGVWGGLTESEARRRVEVQTGLSESTVKRAYYGRVPKYERPVHKRRR